MKSRKVVRMPHRKTYKREQQLEQLQLQQDIRKGELKNRYIFGGIILLMTGLVYLILWTVGQLMTNLAPIIKNWLLS